MGLEYSGETPRFCTARQKIFAKKRYEVRGDLNRCDRESYRATQKKQKRFYSGKKKRHTIKSQLLVAPKDEKIICTSFSNGKRHDFRLFKESKVHLHPDTEAIVDTGYQGLQKIHPKTRIPKKKTKKNPLTSADKKSNQALARDRVFNENVIGIIKRFKNIQDRYRNRRKRFGLRFNLISGIYNFEVDLKNKRA